ncbi:MAG: nitroreductase family protein [Candidatus Coproplasma sp.]
MDLIQAINERHAVRSYLDKAINEEQVIALTECIDRCNKEGDLHFQLIMNEPKAFDCMMARYGNFSGVKNYIALIGKKCDDFEEKIGYYGEKVALCAQSLGLNTCWVAMSYKKVKTAYTVDEGEKLCVVLALGYGKTQGVQHKSKSAEKVSAGYDTAPDWFKKGVDCALLAPTAVNQQTFYFSYEGNKVTAKAGAGFYSKVDLGIAKCHFEIGAGKENFEWNK